MSTYQSINPATGELLTEYKECDDLQASAVIDAAADAYRLWRKTPLDDRFALLRDIARLYRDQAQQIARVTALETGKPLVQAEGEIAIVADIYDYYADHGAEFLADEPLKISGPGTAVVKTEALGVIIGVMPWNFPHYQTARFVAPNLVLGNSIVLKHARNCPQSALEIERLINMAGTPDGVFVNVFASNEQIAAMIADPRVQGVSLTGSEQAGSAVGEVAGRHMKRAVLELGGSDPMVVLADADLDHAAADAALSRMNNAGQVCTALKRMIVVEDAYEAFVEKFVAKMQEFATGDPLDSAAALGPLSTLAARDDVAAIVDDAVQLGAEVLTGAQKPEGDGAYYPATVLSRVTPQMRAYKEEIFGPVAVVHRATSVKHAVELANDTPFGLAGSVYTSNPGLAAEVADALEVGMATINGMNISAPDLPFGGVKGSGIGRELSKYGINEFANKKLIRSPRG